MKCVVIPWHVQIPNAQKKTIPRCRCPGSCSFLPIGLISPTWDPRCPFFVWDWELRACRGMSSSWSGHFGFARTMAAHVGGWVLSWAFNPSTQNAHPTHFCCFGDEGRERPAWMDEISCFCNGPLTCSYSPPAVWKLMRHHLTTLSHQSKRDDKLTLRVESKRLGRGWKGNQGKPWKGVPQTPKIQAGSGRVGLLPNALLQWEQLKGNGQCAMCFAHRQGWHLYQNVGEKNARRKFS